MTTLGERIWDYLDDDAVDRLVTYYREKPGRMFDTLGGGGDQPKNRDAITTDDIVAVSLLGVNIPGRAALELLNRSPDVFPRLGAISYNTDLWACPDRFVNESSMANEYWQYLTSIDGIGWVTAGKLLARKRPRLIPVFDSVVKAALMPHDSDLWWVSLRQTLMDDPNIVDRLTELKKQAKLRKAVSLLRVLDVSVWMTSQTD